MADWESSREKQKFMLHGDPFLQPVGGGAAGSGDIHLNFMSSWTTREQDEMARRKAEHMESAEHIAPQSSYPTMYSSNNKTAKITEKALREHFHLPLSGVAKKFNMCTTAFKKLCRKQGIMQWPHRTLRSLEKKIATLQAEDKFTNDHQQIAEQIKILKAKQEAILSGKGLNEVMDNDGMIVASPSDDSSSFSSAATSGTSSPGASEIFSSMGLDDTTSYSPPNNTAQKRNRSMNDVPSFAGHHAVFSSQQMQSHPLGMRAADQQDTGMRRAMSHDNFHHLRGNSEVSSSSSCDCSSIPTPQQLMDASAGFGQFNMDDSGMMGLEGRVRYLTIENENLKSIIAMLAQERVEWMRKNESAQTEMMQHRMMCNRMDATLREQGIQVPRPDFEGMEAMNFSRVADGEGELLMHEHHGNGQHGELQHQGEEEGYEGEGTSRGIDQEDRAHSHEHNEDRMESPHTHDLEGDAASAYDVSRISSAEGDL